MKLISLRISVPRSTTNLPQQMNCLLCVFGDWKHHTPERCHMIQHQRVLLRSHRADLQCWTRTWRSRQSYSWPLRPFPRHQSLEHSSGWTCMWETCTVNRGQFLQIFTNKQCSMNYTLAQLNCMNFVLCTTVSIHGHSNGQCSWTTDLERTIPHTPRVALWHSSLLSHTTWWHLWHVGGDVRRT